MCLVTINQSVKSIYQLMLKMKNCISKLYYKYIFFLSNNDFFMFFFCLNFPMYQDFRICMIIGFLFV